MMILAFFHGKVYRDGTFVPTSEQIQEEPANYPQFMVKQWEIDHQIPSGMMMG
jgi:hypothetical protein